MIDYKSTIGILKAMYDGWALRSHSTFPSVLEKGTVQFRIEEDTFDHLFRNGMVKPCPNNYRDYCEFVLDEAGYRYIIESFYL